MLLNNAGVLLLSNVGVIESTDILWLALFCHPKAVATWLSPISALNVGEISLVKRLGLPSRFVIPGSKP
jgi:hypothetical protein